VSDDEREGGVAQPPYGYNAAPNPYYAARAPQPGCIPLRPLAVSDILDGTFKVIRRNPRVTLGLSAIVAVIQVVCTAGFQVIVFRQLSQVRLNETNNPNDSSANLAPLLTQLTAVFSIVVIGALLGAVLTGMLTHVVTQDVLGVKVNTREVWDRVKGRMWPLIRLSLLLTLLQGIGLALCLAPGIWLWGIWAAAVPAFVVEGTTIRGAMRRSRQLVSGTFWRVWGIRALGALLVSIVGSLVGLPFTLLGLALSGGGLDALTGQSASLPAAYLVLSSIGSVVTVTFTAPVRAGIDALLYVDLRMRKEGMDIALQQAAGQRAAAPPATQPPPTATAF
jgi:hypothetical protein